MRLFDAARWWTLCSVVGAGVSGCATSDWSRGVRPSRPASGLSPQRAAHPVEASPRFAGAELAARPDRPTDASTAAVAGPAGPREAAPSGRTSEIAVVAHQEPVPAIKASLGPPVGTFARPVAPAVGSGAGAAGAASPPIVAPALGTLPGGTATTWTTMTLADLENLALANNPTIRELSASSRQGHGVREQVGLRPNPHVGLFAYQLFDEGTDQSGFHVEQQFVRGGKLELNREVLAHATEAHLWATEAQRVRVLTDVRMRFYEALAAQQKIALMRDFAGTTARAVDVAVQRKQAGEGTEIDVLQARIEHEQATLEGRRAEFESRGAWQGLAAAAGVPDLAPVPLAADLDVGAAARDWDAVYAGLLARSPDLAAARATVRQARAYLERQRAQPIPNVTVEAQAGFDNSTDAGLVNLEMHLPVPVHNKNQGNIAAAYAAYCRAVHEVNRRELELKRRLADVTRDYDGALASVQVHRSAILPQARELLRLSMEAFEAGEIDYLDLRQVQDGYLQASLRTVDAQRELALAKSQIDGLLLTGALDEPPEFREDDGLRDQALSGE